ncbi:GntR family transcriptional repressor for pyruvate dehydrogenase complex [Rhodoligotrophos appendicifer]|uniref:transcriptional regulator NanR n=1 Tax=Rhodoligotrophos appendicifer TaxID=987056 RepID=UPI001186A41E|nr:transcriptional regulator NanR [Rhodoligotrophos appendicifer]
MTQEITRPSEQIERRRLSDEVRERFQKMIASGEYAAGDILPSERELMERFGVGRPAIREALFSLQRMGLVALTSGARARVTVPSADRLIHELSGAAAHMLSTGEGERAFQDARLFFEVGLARHAAQFASESDVEGLKAALDANEAALDDIETFQRTDVDFHRHLAMIPRNPIFKAIHDGLETWLTKQRTVSLMVPGASHVANRYHQQIYRAVADRAPDRAEQAMRDHLLSVSELYWQSTRRK